MQADGLRLELLEVLEPLRDREPLFGRPGPHCDTGVRLRLQRRDDGAAELVQEVPRGRRLDRVPEPGHLAEAAHPRANAQGALAAKFHCDEAEGLVAGRDEGEFCAAEDVRG